MDSSIQDYRPDFDRAIRSALAGHSKPSLVVLFSPRKTVSSNLFADFKQVADRDIGTHSICLAAASASGQKWSKNKRFWQDMNNNAHKTALQALGLRLRNDQIRRHLANLREASEEDIRIHMPNVFYNDRLPQYMANVSMKLNLKLNHTNHTVQLPPDVNSLLSTANADPLVDTLILGADVTHPLQDSPNPSIAAIVGSVDGHFARYLGSVRYQEGKKGVYSHAIALEQH